MLEEIEILNFIGVSLGFGLLSLLTPCVFPMIPITVSYFTKRSEAKRNKSIQDAFIYVIGIITTFSMIGLVTALFFGASQISKIAANPWINLCIAVIFITFGLNLFGIFEIKINNRFINQFRSHKNSKGFISVFLIAVVFTLTTFTCTMPFVGTILVTASRGNILYPLIGMFCYGLTFSLPFFFLVLFPQFVQRLPRSGEWMYTIKIAMGFLELAASLKFLSNADMVWRLNIITREIFLIIWSVIFVLLGLNLLKIIRFPFESNSKISVGRWVLATVTLLFAVHLFYAKDQKTFQELEAFLPPPEYGNKQYISHLIWIKNLSEAKKKAIKTNQFIFIDFTGYTCVNCRWMEQNLFTRKKIENMLEKFILVRLYTDGDGVKHRENQRLQSERFNTIALPLYVILTPDDRIVSTFEGMTRDSRHFIKFLNSIYKFK